MMDECRLHGVYRNLLKVAEGQVVLLRCDGHLLGQIRVAHQSVVRAQEHAEPVLEEEREGMLLVAFGGTCAHIAGETHLHRYAPVQDELRKGAELQYATVLYHHVLNETHPMADPVGTADLYRLPDRLQAERFAGVDRDVEVLAPDVPECLYVLLRRMAVFVACYVEGHDAAVLERNRELGDVQRACGVLVAHGAQYEAVLHTGCLTTSVQACENGGDNLLQIESSLRVQVGGEAQLRVYHVLCGEVLHGLECDAFQILLALHDRGGVGEGLQIERQALLPASSHEPLPELRLAGRWKFYAVLCGELYDGAYPESSVQMVVEFDLWDPSYHVLGNHA